MRLNKLHLALCVIVCSITSCKVKADKPEINLNIQDKIKSIIISPNKMCNTDYKILLDNNGAISIIYSIKNGKPNGRSYLFNDGYLDSEGDWVNGKMDGIWMDYSENGKLKREINYCDGILDGEIKHYDSIGLINKIEVYKNGKYIGVK